MKKIIILCLMALMLSIPISTHTVYATETNETTEEFDIFDALINNMANADIDEEDLKEANKELYGDENYNPLKESKDSIKKFSKAFSEKEYDSNDFNGNADKVYDEISEKTEDVADSGILDGIYNFGTSILNLFVNIISSIGESLK